MEWLLRNDANTASYVKGDGDFRSDECVALLKEADIVVTNPPFSQFRDYVAQLKEYSKNFLIMGNANALKYKEIFPLLIGGQMWLGVNNGTSKRFRVPDSYENSSGGNSQTVVDGIYKELGNVNWFTNLDHKKRHQKLILYKRFNPSEYPHYDNYDAINVDKVRNIPKDWPGEMGVPITFLDKFNPDQFEIVGLDRPIMKKLTGRVTCFWLNGKELYSRIVIRHKKGNRCK